VAPDVPPIAIALPVSPEEASIWTLPPRPELASDDGLTRTFPELPLGPDRTTPAVFELPDTASPDTSLAARARPESPENPESPEVAEPVAVDLPDPPLVPEPPPVEPDVAVVLALAGPVAPVAPVGPEVADDAPDGLEVAAPVLPPVVLPVADDDPVLPEVPEPVADDVAAPELPPVPVAVTAPELPDVADVLTAPDPPPPEALPDVPPIACASPVDPEEASISTLPPLPELASDDGRTVTFPESPLPPETTTPSVFESPDTAEPSTEFCALADPE
jgi:hypothetical protein